VSGALDATTRSRPLFLAGFGIRLPTIVDVPRIAVLVLLAVLGAAACASAPDRAYFPSPRQPETVLVSERLYRAAQAAGDDPARYSFGLVKTRAISAYTTDEATFYFSEGLARQPVPVVDALVAHEVAHEILGHAGQRRILSLSLSAGFTVLGVVIPGAGLIDLLVSPLIVRAFTRDQEIAADLRAVEILRTMGHQAPRRALADALRAAAALNGRSRGGLLDAEPDLADRLAALEPLEPPGPLTATSAAHSSR
jgi:Zn-dependent protease with chaperone function